MWTCIACERTDQSRKRPPLCICGVEGSWEQSETSHTPGANGSRARAVRATDLRVAPIVRVPSGDDALDQKLGGGWALAHSALLWGKGGAGKSRLAYRWATRIGPTLGVVLEHNLDLARRTADECGADLGQLFFLGPDDWRCWETEADRLGVRAIVFDSVTAATGDQVALTKQIADWARARKAFAFVIAQATKSGDAAGAEALKHWPDAAIAVHRRPKGRAQLRVLKSRFCVVFSAVVSLAAS